MNVNCFELPEYGVIVLGNPEICCFVAFVWVHPELPLVTSLLEPSTVIVSADFRHCGNSVDQELLKFWWLD